MLEGEQLKRYVDSLERDLNRAAERGVVGRNSKVIASNNKVLDSENRKINTVERAIQLRQDEADAIEAVNKRIEETGFIEGKLRRARSPKSIEKWTKALEDSSKALEAEKKQRNSLTRARVLAEQTADSAVRRSSQVQQAATEVKKKAREEEAAGREELQKRIAVTRDAERALNSYSAGFSMHEALLEREKTANRHAIDSSMKMTKTFDSASDSLTRYTREHNKLIEMMNDPKSNSSAIARQLDRTSDSYLNMDRRIRDTTKSLRAHIAEEAKAASAFSFGRMRRGMPDPAGVLARNLGALTPLGTVSASLLLPLGTGFFEVASGAAAAAQSIWLLPGAISAAGAGFGVLQMATMGLSDAFTAMMDFNNPDKFAEALRLMSPAAQQFMLSVQQLVPTFMELKNAVQDTFFAGMPQVINGLAKTYRDAFGGMSIGISQFFNDMFKRIASTLQDPRGQQAMASLFDGIVKSFQALMPMIGPLTQAFIQIASVGAQVLPSVTSDIADMVVKFGDFVNTAAASGDLKKWMAEGWEAIKALGSVVVYTGKMLYDVFGLHGPEDIKRFKETLFGLIDGFGIFFGALEKFFHGVVRMVDSIASSGIGQFLGDILDKIGGIESVLAFLAGGLLIGKIVMSFYKWYKFLRDGLAVLKEYRTTMAAIDAVSTASDLANMGDFLAVGKTGKGGFKGAVSSMGELITKIGVFASLSAAVFLTWQQIIDKIRSAEYVPPDASVVPPPGSPGREVYNNGGLSGLLAIPKKMGGMGPDPGEPGFDPNWLRNLPADKRPGAMRDAQRYGVPFNPPTAGPGPAPGQDPIWGTGQMPNPNQLGNLGLPFGNIPDYPDGGLPVPIPNPGGGSTPNIPYGQYSLDSIPLGQFGGANWAPPDPRSLMGQLTPNQLSQKGYGYVVDPQAVFDAETQLSQQRAAVEEARARVLELAADNQATEQDKIKAQNNIVEAERNFIKTQVNLLEAQRGTWKKINDSIMDQSKMLEGIGAEIDADFGISKGLPGIAENLTKFLANITAAPLYGQLAAQRAAGGDLGGAKGLLGAAALSGAFGPQFMQPEITVDPQAGVVVPNGTVIVPNGTTVGGTPAVPPNLGGGTGTGTGAGAPLGGPGLYPSPGQGMPMRWNLPIGMGYPGDAAILSQIPKGIGRYDSVTKDLTKGLVDCASGVEDLVNIIDGKSTAGGSLTTFNAASVLPGMGFQRGKGGPGDFRIGYTNSGTPHMEATLPDGTPVNFGSTSSIQSGGVAGAGGANSPQFTDFWYRPMTGPGGSPDLGPVGRYPSPGQGMPMPWRLPPLTPGGGAGIGGPGPVTPGGTGGLTPDAGNYAPLTPSQLTGTGLTNPLPLAPGGYAPPGTGPSQIGAVVGPPEGTGSGFGGFSGGILGAAQGAISAAAGAAGMMGGMGAGGPAAAALAQIGIEELNRAIAFAGQAAGIGVSGLMETFLPTGGSELANNNWFTRLVGGVVGMKPLLPNFANISGASSNVNQHLGNNAQGSPGPGNVNVTQNNYNPTGNSTTSDLDRLGQQAAAASLPAMGVR